MPLIRNGEVVERPADQSTLTNRYTEEAVKFIREQQWPPVLPLPRAHDAARAAVRITGVQGQKSARHLRRRRRGDRLKRRPDSRRTAREGLAEKTLVFFTSDNGPWLTQGTQGGSAGLLRDGKGSTWEGGMRVPASPGCPAASGPASRHEPASTIDLFPTALSLAGASPPADVTLDGRDISPFLFEQKTLTAYPFFYYRGDQIFACRLADWKAHFRTQTGYGQAKLDVHDPPLLFNLRRDPSERFNVAAQHPQVIAQIQQAVKAHRAAVVPGAPQLK